MKKKIIIISLLLTAVAITTITLAQNTGNKTTQSKKKFIYSRLYYNYLWDKIGDNKHEYFAQGVSQEASKKIAAMNLTEAMNFMGADGWELVSAYTDEISLGTQYAYIFKKEAY